MTAESSAALEVTAHRRKSSGSEKRRRNEQLKLGLYRHEREGLEALAAAGGFQSPQEFIRHRLGPEIAEALAQRNAQLVP